MRRQQVDVTPERPVSCSPNRRKTVAENEDGQRPARMIRSQGATFACHIRGCVQ